MSREGIKFKIEDYLEIDTELSMITFMGISVTGCVGYLIKESSSHGKYYPSGIRSILGLIYHYLQISNMVVYRSRFKELPENKNKKLTNKYFFIVNSTKPSILDQVMPIVHALGETNCIFFSSFKNYREQLKAIYFSYPVLSKSEFKDWKTAFRKEKKNIWSSLKKIKARHNLNYYATASIYVSIMHQTQLNYSFSKLIEANSPKAVITDADRHVESAAMITTANYHLIPTVGLIHGSIFPADNWIPFLSQNIFCWGEYQINHIKKIKQDKANLLIAGNPKLSPDPKWVSEEKLKKMFPGNSDVILLVTNNIEIEERIKLAEDFCMAISQLQNVTGCLRLHQAETVDEYSRISKKYPDIKILDNADLTLDEMLHVSKVVVVHNSTVSIEALVKRKNVVLLDTIQYGLGIGEELFLKANCLKAKSSEELLEIIRHLITDPIFYRERIDMSRGFIEKYCAYFGEDAAARSAELIKILCQKTNEPSKQVLPS